MSIPQPFYIEWSPSTTPLGDRVLETLGRAWSLTVDRDDSGKPGSMAAQVRNGNNAGVATVHTFEQWRRWTQIRVVSDFGGGTLEWFNGHVSQLEHLTNDLPFAGAVAVKAVDALGIWNRDTIARDATTFPDGFLGFATTATGVAAELDAASTAIGTPDILGDARAPVALPAEFKDDDDKISHARFSSNAIEALKKSLDVEAGTMHIGGEGVPVVNGRYVVPDAFVDDPDPAVVLRHDGIGGAGYIRGSLKFADPIAEYRNKASVTGLAKLEHTAGTPDAGDPTDAIEFGALWCQDENWVEADALLYAKLGAGYRQTWPVEVSVVVWHTAMTDAAAAGAFAMALANATSRLGRQWCTVSAQLPGEAEVTWVSTIVGCKLAVSSVQAVVTLILAPRHARWAEAYGGGVTDGVPALPKIFALGAAGRGLGSGAILGP